MIQAHTTEFLSFLSRVKWKTGLPLEVGQGKTYLRLYYRQDDKEKTFCFVHTLTGGIHRPQNHHSPDTHGARGCIFSQDLGMECVEVDGIKKLKVGKPLGFKHSMVIPRPNARKTKTGDLKPYKRVPKPSRYERPVHHPQLVYVPAITFTNVSPLNKVLTELQGGISRRALPKLVKKQKLA